MLKLPAIFSDHMVLQRNKRIAVFGTSEAAGVTVTLTGLRKPVTVTAAVTGGHFHAELPPQTAGGPYTLTVSETGNDATASSGIEGGVSDTVTPANSSNLTFTDVMIGEVWLAGGQSNMEFELQNCTGGREITEAPGVRYYYTPKVAWVGDELTEAERVTVWKTFSPEAAANWSAVGFFFAKELSERLGVTVGVVGCNWGGTSATCWISRETIAEHKSLDIYLKEYDDAVEGQDFEAYLKELEEYTVYQAEFDKNVGNYYATCPNPSWDEAIALFGENRYPGPQGPHNFCRPCGLYESMIQRVAPYTLAGFIYYQGENDDHRPTLYSTLLEALVDAWRKEWKDDTLPFLNVQLPVFRNEGEDDFGNWPFIREAQADIYNKLKNTGLAVVLEMGEEFNIHPLDKKPVGRRLALQALYHVYGFAIEAEAFGPMYKDHYVCGNQMVLTFDHAAQGFYRAADPVTGFEIAGADKVYYPADADIQGSMITLSSSRVSAPVYARYFWRNYGPVTLFGLNRLPLAPFRTSREDGAVATGNRQGLPMI